MVPVVRISVARRKLKAPALYEWALGALARRSHTLAEMDAKIRQRCADEGDADVVIGRLRAHGYLDDARVAESHSAIRRDQGSLGRRRVLRELKRRGIEESIAENAISHAYRDCDESAMAREFLRRKMRARPGRARIREPRQLARLFRALARAGFESDAIADALREVAEDSELLESLLESASSSDTAD